MAEGECKIPFMYKKKQNYECIDGKNGPWCATVIDDNQRMLKYGYCKLKDEMKEGGKEEIVKNRDSIYANKINVNGKINNSKKIKEGKCKFPFKYYGKLREECVTGKKGDWCATEVDENLKP